ncbi:MAG TPA: 5-deoxy-glucuronate isomerase [Opitutaceae bacterium]|nr:5-deoxy-glucuronate isomerase [Opitutaceae bacterium]
MPRLIRAPASAASKVIVPAGESPADLCHFQLLRLEAGREAHVRVPGFETLFVVLSGRADIAVGRQQFEDVGRRADIWSGRADSVYAGTDREVIVTARSAGTEVAVAGGKCARTFTPFRIPPKEVEMVDVGSGPTHSRRRIFHLLGQRAAGRAGNLLVSELYADAGCWSGYPPHKHDAERPPEETEFQEIYHYRFRPETGFGAQFCYLAGGPPKAVMTRHGDTFLVDRGYHPTAASPGHEGYIFTILVGRHQRSLIQYFDPAHRHLMAAIPGLQGMRDKFK